jgi:sugar O-acyltransferase (sialic acid O-acetyltransferase NeuD family)
VSPDAARRLLVLGAGGHARAVADLAEACGWRLAGFLGAHGAPITGGVIGSDDDLATLRAEGRFDGAIVGVGNTALARRPALFARLRELGVATPSLVHPTATVSPSARIGDGCVVFPHTVVGADTAVGEDAVIYSGSVLEHGCRIADHAYLAPGVILCGNVRVEAGAFVGAGAIVVPGVVIGKGAVVYAGARVVRDVSAGGTYSAVSDFMKKQGLA